MGNSHIVKRRSPHVQNMRENKPNILFICIDSMRSDFSFGNFGSYKPFFKRFEDNGAVFDTMISSASSTTPCVAGYMTGEYPPEHGIHSLRDFSLDSDVTTLAEHFKSAGYVTTAHVCGPITRDTGLDTGFDNYEYRDRNQTVYTEWFEDFKTNLASASKPWFTYLHLWEPHIHRDLPHDVTVDEIEYDASLRGAAKKLDELRSVVDLEKTVIAVTGDHGESFYDGTARQKATIIGLNKIPIPFTSLRTRNIRSIAAEKIFRPRGIEPESYYNSLRRLSKSDFPNAFHREGHGYQIYDFLITVPFALAGPNIPSQMSLDSQVRQIDIFPTLLAAAGLDVPEDIEGEDLLEGTISSDIAHIRAVGAFQDSDMWLDGVRTGDWKFIKGRERPLRQLFNLQNDPYELTNVVSEHPKKAAELEMLVDQFVSREQTDKTPNKEAEQRMNKRLKDLGYL